VVRPGTIGTVARSPRGERRARGTAVRLDHHELLSGRRRNTFSRSPHRTADADAPARERAGPARYINDDRAAVHGKLSDDSSSPKESSPELVAIVPPSGIPGSIAAMSCASCERTSARPLVR
jgi:hypothetical protein